MAKNFRLMLALAAVLCLAPQAARAEDYTIILKDHQFSPSSLSVPAGKKVKLVVKNQQAVPAEFESYELNREKVIGPQGEVTIFIGPLDPGSYTYFDDFNSKTSKGVIIAK